jgi:hypothetical protein
MPADEKLTDQDKAIGLVNGFHDHDVAALGRLTAAGRAEQQEIRERLYMYIDQIWDHVKAHSGVMNPASHRDYSAVAGMRDLATELRGNAWDASEDAGDNLEIRRHRRGHPRP